MARKDPRVDAYIVKSAPFARPILRRLRALVHRGCPGVEETIKWGFPHFEHHGILCSMASFQRHCAFGFWNRALALDANREAMGQFGRIAALSDLPSDAALVALVRRAARLNEQGRKVGPIRRPKKPLPVPPALTAALRKKAGALAKFRALSPSRRREYGEWILEAKTAATRQKRVAVSAGWIAAGKALDWKYERPKKRR